MEEVDPRLAGIVDGVLHEGANASVYGHQLTDPTAAARANTIARQWGLPPEVVEADPKPWEAQQRINQGRSLAQTTPQAAGWLTNPRNAAAVGNDYQGLQKVAQVFTLDDYRKAGIPIPQNQGTLQEPVVKPTLGSWLYGIYQSMVGGTEEVKAGGNQLLRDVGVHGAQARPGIPQLGDDPEANKRAYEAAEANIALSMPTFKSKTARALYGGVSGVATMLPGLAASIATGNPGPIAAQFGLSGFLGGYGKYRSRGDSPATAALGGGLEGVINAGTAYIPGGYVASRFGKSALGEFTAGLLMREIPMFQAQTHALDAVDTALSPGKTWQDYWSSRPDAAYDALIGALPIALLGAPSAALRHFQMSNEASTNAGFIDNLMNAAQQSKARTSAPEEFQSFIDAHVRDGQHEHVFIPGDAVSTLFQTADGEPGQRNIATDPFWSKYEPAIRDAQATGGDVVLPTAEVATHLAGTPDWNALRDHVRFSADGMSMAEAREYRKTAPEQMEKAAADIAAKLDEIVPNIAARKAISEKLASLPYSDEQRSTLATLIASKLMRDTSLENEKRATAGKEPVHPVDVLKAWNLHFENAKQASFEKASKGAAKPAKAASDFDPLPHLAAFTKYVGDRSKSLDRAAIAKEFGIAPEHADRLLGISASTPGSPIFITKGASAKYRTVQTGGGKKAGTKRVLVSEATPSTIRRVPQRRGPVDVIDFLKDRGGVRDDAEAGHALAQSRNWLKRFPGLVSKKGMSLDDAAQALHEAGYFDGAERPTVDDALQMIENGRGRYRSADTSEIENRRQAALQDEHVQKATAEIDRALSENPLLKGVADKMEPEDRQAVLERMATGEAADAAIYGHMEEKSRDVLRDAGNDSASTDFDVPFDQKGGSDGALGDLLATGGQAGNGSDGRARSPGDAEAGGRAGADLPQPGGSREGSLGLDAEQHGLTPQEQRHLAEMEARLQQSKIRRDHQQAASDIAGGLFDSARDQGSLFQGESRGNISFARDEHGIPTAAVIRTFQAANFSTAIHEMGHFWLEDLRTRALRPDATGQEKADWSAVKGWFGELGHETGDTKAIPTEAHEYWARGMERYVMEGKAPSPALKVVFAKMAQWMRQLYRSVMALDAPITPEIRDVMDRMFASDEEIATAREEMRVRPLEGAEALMNEGERAAYQKAGADARDEAYESLLDRVMRNIRYRRTREYAEQKRAIKDEVTAQVDTMPVHQALKVLRNGVEGEPVKIPRQWVIDNYGEDALDRLPKGVNPITAETGINPEEIAARAGFKSADEMMHGLFDHAAQKEQLKAADDKRGPRQAQIDEAMKARIEADLPDPMLDIEREARAAIATDKAGELLSMESRALARKTGKTPTPYQMAKEWARGHLLTQRTLDALTGTAVQRYARAVAKEGKAAEEAMLAGDYETALLHKNRQIANAALLSEGKKLKEDVERASRKLGRIAKARTMPSVDQGYLEQAHALLEQVRMTTESGPRLKKVQSFQRWYEAQIADGREPIVPGDYGELLGTQHWRELPASDLLQLKDVVDQIMELGRLKQTLLDGKKRRDYEGAVGEMAARADENPIKRQRSSLYKDRSLGERVKATIRSADAANLKFEQLMNFMDNAQPNGPWQRMMMNPLAQAQAIKMRLLRPLRDSLQHLIDETPKEVKQGWLREVETPELLNWVVPPTDETHGQPWRFTKDQVLAMALNWGNEGNRQRLLDGYKWNEEAVRAVFDRTLNEHDWHFVQGVLDTVDTLWPAIEALEKRVNGFAPEKVEATPIETPHGTFRGGYFPAVYDPEFSANAERREVEKLTGGGFYSLNTRASATHDRLDHVERPLLLSMSVVTRHLNEVVHDLSHREAVYQVKRLLSDDRIKTAIDSNMGPEYRRRAMDYLENVAQPGIADSKQDKGLINFARALNKRITVAGLGFRLSTILQQPTAFANTMAEVGNLRYASMFAKFHADPRGMWKTVSEASEEMRERLHNIDANINEMYQQQAKNPLILGPSKISEWAFRGIAATDLYITIPGWMAAFDKATTELKMPDDEAIHYADGIIRKTQGSGGAKDQAAIQRTIWMKAFNPFFSYWSAHYNQLRSIGHEARRVRDGQHVANLVNRFALQAIVPMAIQGWFFGGPQGQDESDLHYLIKMTALGNLGALPGVNAITSTLGFGYPYHVSPWARFFESAEKVGHDIVKGYRHEEGEGDEPKSWIKDAFDAMSYSFAIPASQIGATLQGLHDYSRGEAHPESVSDWSQLVQKGKIEQHR